MKKYCALALFLASCAETPEDAPAPIITVEASRSVTPATTVRVYSRLIGDWEGETDDVAIHASVTQTTDTPFFAGYMVDKGTPAGANAEGYVVDNDPDVAFTFVFDTTARMNFTGRVSNNDIITGTLNGSGFTDYAFELKRQ
jgi:hypothetical protein